MEWYELFKTMKDYGFNDILLANKNHQAEEAE